MSPPFATQVLVWMTLSGRCPSMWSSSPIPAPANKKSLSKVGSAGWEARVWQVAAPHDPHIPPPCSGGCK